MADTLRPVAQAVTGAPAARWWSGGLDPAAQQYVESLLGNGEGPPLSGASSRLSGWRVTGWAGPWLMPDYAAAAADYEAIHLTVGGYLTTAGRALAVNDARCLLAGWDPDKTYWLADVLAGADPPVRWIRDDSVHLGWRQADSPL